MANPAGVQRITYAELLAERRMLKEMMRQHRKECSRCEHARKTHIGMCVMGYSIASDLSCTQYAIREWKEAVPVGQLELYPELEAQ